jgi:hypothetical protein
MHTPRKSETLKTHHGLSFGLVMIDGATFQLLQQLESTLLSTLFTAFNGCRDVYLVIPSIGHGVSDLGFLLGPE